MRVKKFEAKSMKEALQMVKNDLGPEAVILAAKDNQTRYGIGGEGSVEVTAAVSETTYRKKQFLESRLRESDRERFRGKPAVEQRRIIQTAVERQTRGPVSTSGVEPTPGVRRPITSTSYIDIPDEGQEQQVQSPAHAQQRIRSAVEEALKAGRETLSEVARPAPSAVIRAVAQETAESRAREQELVQLREEVQKLQTVLSGFQKVPQTFVSAHPGAEFGINYDLSFMYQKLMDIGISPENTAEILRQAQMQMDVNQQKKKAMVEAWVAKWFLDRLLISGNPYGGKLQLFVGAAGSGKTSQLVKLASHLVIKEKARVGILSTDVFKVGAADQLKIYAQILNVPFATVRNAVDWEWALSQMRHLDTILVDFPGMQLREIAEIQQFRALLPPEGQPRVCHLVASVTAKDADTFEAARRLKIAEFGDVIFTNLDQSVQHGVIYNFQRHFGAPLHSFGIGARLPEDFEVASKERVLDLFFKLSKFPSL